MREGHSAPLTVHLPKGKGAHPSLDPSVFFLPVPFRKNSGKFDTKTRRLGGAGQGGGEEAMGVISLHDASLVRTLSCHLRTTVVVSKHSPCCPRSLSPRAPQPASERHGAPSMWSQCWTTFSLGTPPQQQPRSPEPSCSLTNETARRDLKALVCQWEKG